MHVDDLSFISVGHVVERIKDMSAQGVQGSASSPSVAQFCGRLFASSPGRDLAMFRADSDWHLDAVRSAGPDRFMRSVGTSGARQVWAWPSSRGAGSDGHRVAC